MADERKDDYQGSEEPTSLFSRTEQYIEENQKSITIIVLAIVVLIGGYFIYKKFILAPREQLAIEEMYMAEKNFLSDSLDLAINGNDNIQGFTQIIEDYGMTHAGNLAQYYKGVALMKLGKFEEAIEALLKFDAGDKFIAAISMGAIGDSYVELKNNEKAVSFYKKAIASDKNDFTTPIFLKKLGLLYEAMNDYEKALKTYEDIKNTYPKSQTAADIDKYITRAEIKTQK